jgi:hypothetical protein
LSFTASVLFLFLGFWVFGWLLYSIFEGALSAHCIPHFCILVHRDNDRISSVQVHFLKAITNTFTVKWLFLHLTVFHLQCNLIQPFHYHSQPLTFSFQSETIILTFLDLQKYINKTVVFLGWGEKKDHGFQSFPRVISIWF